MAADELALELQHVRDVVGQRLEGRGRDAVVDAVEERARRVGALVDAAQVVRELVAAHAVRHVRLVQVRVQHECGEREQEDRLGAVAQFVRDVRRVRRRVALGEHLDVLLNRLRLGLRMCTENISTCIHSYIHINMNNQYE